MEFDLKGDFFDWAGGLLKDGDGAPQRILAYEVEDSALLDPFLQEERTLDALDGPGIALAAEASYDLVLCPTCFLTAEKESVPTLASRLAHLTAPGGSALALFPPAWLPAVWADRVIKFHKEGNTKLYFRFKNHIAAYTFYTNREIETLCRGLRLERLTILHDGFRRAQFIPRPVERTP